MARTDQQLQGNMRQLLSATDVLDTLLKSSSEEEEPSMDDLILYETIHSKQLIDCVAEDHAIQDTYLCLDKALNNQVFSHVPCLMDRGAVTTGLDLLGQV